MGAFIAQFAAAYILSISVWGKYIEECRTADQVAIENTIEELRCCCIKYWSKDATSLKDEDDILSARIMGLITLLNALVQSLYEKNQDMIDAANSEFKLVYRHITGDGFKEPDRKRDTRIIVRLETWAAKYKISSQRRRRKLKRPFLIN